jgi:methylenetetrahydrofolate reductase (NADPH)
MHGVAFEQDAPLHRPGRAFYGAVDGHRRTGKTLHLLEQATKVPMFGCRDCGDCSLPDIAYLCPESQCAKNQRNGPCGGTRQGKCEVGEKDCIWALAYDRLKVYGEEERMLEGPAVVKDNALRGSSAWANTLLGRDHHAKEHGT